MPDNRCLTPGFTPTPASRSQRVEERVTLWALGMGTQLQFVRWKCVDAGPLRPRALFLRRGFTLKHLSLLLFSLLANLLRKPPPAVRPRGSPLAADDEVEEAACDGTQLWPKLVVPPPIETSNDQQDDGGKRKGKDRP